MARRRKRYYHRKTKKPKRKRVQFSLGTSGNMKFGGVRRLYSKASKAYRKISKIS